MQEGVREGGGRERGRERGSRVNRLLGEVWVSI
jgi:hypothetical protein